MLLPLGPQDAPQRALRHRIAEYLVTQIAGVADALHAAIDHADGRVAQIHERHVGHRVAGAGGEHVARTRARDLEAGEAVRDILDPHTVGPVLLKPAHMHRLRAI